VKKDIYSVDERRRQEGEGEEGRSNSFLLVQERGRRKNRK